MVELIEDSLLKAARVYIVFYVLKKHAEVIYSNPPVSDLEEENFDYSFKLIYVTEAPTEEIKAKILKVSEITKVEIEGFSLDAYKKKQEKAEDEIVAQAQSQQKQKTETETSKQTATTSMRAAPTKTIRVNIDRKSTRLNSSH